MQKMPKNDQMGDRDKDQNKNEEVEQIEFEFDEMSQENASKQQKQEISRASMNPQIKNTDQNQVEKEQSDQRSLHVQQNNNDQSSDTNIQNNVIQIQQQSNKKEKPPQKLSSTHKNFVVTLRKGSIRRNAPKELKKQPQIDLSTLDEALQLAYRMNKLRKQRQQEFYRKMSHSIQIKNPPRKIGGIRHVQRDSPGYSLGVKKSYDDIERQKLILERSKKATQMYQMRKYLQKVLYEIADDVTEKIQQKRSFFSYKFHTVLGKKGVFPKMGGLINLSNSMVSNKNTRIKLHNLQGLTISNSRARNLGLSSIQAITIQKQEVQSDQSDEQDQQSQSDEEQSSQKKGQSNEESQIQDESQSQQQEKEDEQQQSQHHQQECNQKEQMHNQGQSCHIPITQQDRYSSLL